MTTADGHVNQFLSEKSRFSTYYYSYCDPIIDTVKAELGED